MTRKEKESFMEKVNETAFYFNDLNKWNPQGNGTKEFNAKLLMLYDLAPQLNCAFDFYRDVNSNIVRIEFNERLYEYF